MIGQRTQYYYWRALRALCRRDFVILSLLRMRRLLYHYYRYRYCYRFAGRRRCAVYHQHHQHIINIINIIMSHHYW